MLHTVLALQNGAAPERTLVGLLPILLIVGIFYLLIYRPMRQRQKNLEKLVSSLKNGDKVITNGGIYGTVSGLKENTILLKVSDQIKVEVAKNAIASLQPGHDESAPK